ncbi:cysteine protease [Pleosporales sp. CAS-2024a]
MAETTRQLDAYKAAAEQYRSQLQSATSKDDALTLAISAAESLMKALKLSANSNERKLLKAQCSDAMNTASRIKSDDNWTPAAKSHPVSSGKLDINQWAANVDSASSTSTGLGNSTSQSSASHHAHSSANEPIDKLSTTSGDAGNISTSLSSVTVRSKQTHALTHILPRSQTDGHNHLTDLLVDDFLSPNQVDSGASTDTRYEDRPPTKHDRAADAPSSSEVALSSSPVPTPALPPSASVHNEVSASASPSMAPYSSIRRLVEPASTRKRSKREDIILLKASIVNGFKCPPWDNNPPSEEFVLGQSEGLYTQMLTNKLYPFDKNLGRPVISSNGKYIVRLNFNGCWRKVVIDDRLPVSSTHRLLHVVDRRNPALLWPALLEKAYLKIRGGYDFPGSNSCSDLWTLTGWIPEQIFLQETDTVPGQLWNRIYNAFRYGDVLITAGTGRMSSRQEQELGLEGQHSYVVLDMKETTDHDCLLLVKNPWVEGKGWRGPHPLTTTALDSSTSSDASKTKAEAYHGDSVPSQDGPYPTTFWIGLEQVIRNFESLYLNWNPGLFKHRQDIHFEWDIASQQLPSGCIFNHPQFSFSAKTAGVVWVLLSRHFRDVPTEIRDQSDTLNDGTIRPDSQVDSSGEHPKGYMSIYVCSGRGQRLYIKETYLESSDYVTTPQCVLRWDAEANATYTMVVDQDELPPSLYTFSLSAFSNSSISLEPATRQYPVETIEQGAWTRQCAGGSTSSGRYFENPQYSLELRERGALAILLTSGDEHPMHVKLVLGHGKRIYKLQSRDVLADSGNHGAGCVLAEIQDVQPGLYTIICSLFEAGQTGEYRLKVDSTAGIVLKPIARDGAGLLSLKLAPACFGAQMHKIAAPMLPRRLASYTIVTRFVRATSPRSNDLGMLARSPLRFSVELGRGPERKFIIASERGEYSDAATVRSERVHIDPDITQQGDVYLVLDRLSGPGGPVEEWYDVEMFTDAPQACSIGVWREWDD